MMVTESKGDKLELKAVDIALDSLKAIAALAMAFTGAFLAYKKSVPTLSGLMPSLVVGLFGLSFVIASGGLVWSLMPLRQGEDPLERRVFRLIVLFAYLSFVAGSAVAVIVIV